MLVDASEEQHIHTCAGAWSRWPPALGIKWNCALPQDRSTLTTELGGTTHAARKLDKVGGKESCPSELVEQHAEQLNSAIVQEQNWKSNC